MNDIKNAAIKIKSTINGDEIYNEYAGEYMYQNGIHTIAYSSYSGTELTKNGIQASENVMLLHREGAFEGDMYFDVNSDTIVRYDALMVRSGFLLHTEKYSLDFKEDEVNIVAEYTLTDGSGQDDIHCRQEILVKLESI